MNPLLSFPGDNILQTLVQYHNQDIDIDTDTFKIYHFQHHKDLSYCPFIAISTTVLPYPFLNSCDTDLFLRIWSFQECYKSGIM